MLVIIFSILRYHNWKSISKGLGHRYKTGLGSDVLIGQNFFLYQREYSLKKELDDQQQKSI